MILYVCIFLLLLVFFLPFIPAIAEYLLKHDAKPLYIKNDYVRNPAYFAESFKQLIQESMDEDSISVGQHELSLSKNEKSRVFDSAEISDGVMMQDVCFVKENLRTGDSVIFLKEIYVRGDALLGRNNQIRALACDGEIKLEQGTIVQRWVDSLVSLRVGEECDLGVSASCRNELWLGRGCSFKRLYAFPVIAGGNAGLAAAFLATMDSEQELVCIDFDPIQSGGAERFLSYIPPRSRKSSSIITHSSLEVGELTVVCGHIKAYGDLTLGKNVVVSGNLFAEGIIRIGEGCRILGSVFSHDRVVIGAGAIVGSTGEIKSVIGKKGIRLESGATIYGFIMTEGEGFVV